MCNHGCIVSDTCFVYSGGEDFNWTYHAVSNSCTGQPPHLIPSFESASGPFPQTKSATTPLQVYLTVLILQSIVDQTVACAARKGVALSFCAEELQAFIGMNVAVGMLRLRDYWATDEVFSTP